GVVDTRREVIQIGEHAGPSLVLKQPLVGRRAFQDAPFGRNVSEQRKQAAARPKRILGGANDVPIDESWRLSQAILERFPCDRATLQMAKRLEFLKDAASAACR